MRRHTLVLGAALAGALLSGCTVHPKGESDERARAMSEGVPYRDAATQRSVPPLPDSPTPDDLVRYALLSSPDLEAKYWEWRSALEQIPQDGTQATNLALSLGTSVGDGALSADRTTISAGNDPMANIVLPSKLSAAANRALDDARAAGKRFEKAKLELRAKVLSAYYDYALTSELIRLERSNASLLDAAAAVVEARSAAGSASQRDVLRVQNERELSQNDILSMEADLVAKRATVNAAIGRGEEDPLSVPKVLPTTRPLTLTNEEILARVSHESPGLQALAHEIQAKRKSLSLAKQEYLPDFAVNFGTDLSGSAQSLMGMITAPFLRYEAINAAVSQAEANIRVAEATRRQFRNDLAAQIVIDLAFLRDAERQLQLLTHVLLPRAFAAVDSTRSGYEVGQVTLLELLESERSVLVLQRLRANLIISRERKLAQIEATGGLIASP